MLRLNGDGTDRCFYCGKRVSVHIFPILSRPAPQKPPQDSTIVGSESSCFYHPTKKASVVCDDCGRFLCGLCDVNLHGKHLCTSCLDKASDSGEKTVAGKRYVHYDSFALVFALIGILFWFASFITAGISLYYVIRYWRTPLSFLPRRRWRFVLAGTVSLGTLGLWSFFFLQLMGNLLS